MLQKLFILALVNVILAQEPPVKVSVYYESLCPDSKAFITNQLWPTYEKLSDIMIVEFVPFGFASYTDNGSGYNFTCQHGPRECEGNLIHSCALKYYPFNPVQVPFIYCSMSAPDSVDACQSCAEDGGLDWDIVSACAYGFEGQQLLVANGEITDSLQPEVTWVPWIIINDVFTQENLDNAQADLLPVICKAYTGIPPAECA